MTGLVAVTKNKMSEPTNPNKPIKEIVIEEPHIPLILDKHVRRGMRNVNDCNLEYEVRSLVQKLNKQAIYKHRSKDGRVDEIE